MYLCQGRHRVHVHQLCNVRGYCRVYFLREEEVGWCQLCLIGVSVLGLVGKILVGKVRCGNGVGWNGMGWV